MKIGIFTDSYLPRLDGVAISVETCVRALRKRGHEVYVVAPEYPNYKDTDKDVYRLSSIKFPTTPGTPEARWALPEKTLLKIMMIDFDVIHGHSGGGIFFIGLPIAKTKNIPFIVTYHTLWNRYTHYFLNGKIVRPKMLEFISKFFGNMCDMLIAPTEKVKNELLTYGVTRPIPVLPSGIELTNYKNIQKGFIREKIKIPDNKKIILSIGRLGEEKSVQFLLHAFRLINQENLDTTLVMVGDGPEEKVLKKLVEKFDLKKSVHFLGQIEHKYIPQICFDSDVFIFASQTETQGLVVIEALASGLPVVAVDDEALSGVVYSGKNGYLVKKDSKIFAGKVLELLKDEILYKKLSENAKKSVEKFSEDKIAKKLEALYIRLIKIKGEKEHKTNITTKTIMNFLIKINNQIKNILSL